MNKQHIGVRLFPGAIVKINQLAIESGFAGSDYTDEDRFEVISVEQIKESCSAGRWLCREVITHKVGYIGDGIDSFPAYLLELA